MAIIGAIEESRKEPEHLWWPPKVNAPPLPVSVGRQSLVFLRDLRVLREKKEIFSHGDHGAHGERERGKTIVSIAP
jgi:hypothetical protein